jgi:hypothetical protein
MLSPKREAPVDLEAKSQAVSRAIMNEELDRASALLQECMDGFISKERSHTEAQQYMHWLRQIESRVLLVRAHLAQRLCRLNHPMQHYRSAPDATWSTEG